MSRYYDLNFKERYRQEMVNFPATCLRIDHTFKIVANIGLTVVNSVTNKKEWKLLYPAVQFILNDHGQVVSWQFCETQAFDVYKDRLAVSSRERDVWSSLYMQTLGSSISVVIILTVAAS